VNDPLEPVGLRAAALRVAPFAAACVAAWAAVLIGSEITWWEYGASLALALATGGATLWTLATGRHAWFAVVPSALLLLAAVALLRDSAGGYKSGASALAILPVFQTALYSRSRRDLAIVLAAVALFFLVPIWIVGSPAYPPTQYRSALLAVVVDGIIGLASQRLVGRVREEAAEARARERMLEQVGEAVYVLSDSARPRAEVCESAMRISNASCAFLYEPVPGTEQLACSVAAGVTLSTPGPVVERRSAAYRAMDTGRSVLVTEDVAAQDGLPDLWEAAGRPPSMLFQPLRHRDARLGALVIGWPGAVRADGPRATVIAMLAREVAAVISRADTLDQLNDEALTDPLTGLPNRRAWDRQLTRVAAAGQRLTVCLLDLDHFKQFNDQHGHPAGDRLLKETAVRWRHQLRAGDFLARIGGEEFGVLFPDADPGSAMQVAARLRASITHDRTCSAGIATQHGDESPEVVIARADAALYHAKTHGRDQTHLEDPRQAPAVD
jgi:diguanylate cyclase (GGDEF)-like protein